MTGESIPVDIDFYNDPYLNIGGAIVIGLVVLLIGMLLLWYYHVIFKR